MKMKFDQVIYEGVKKTHLKRVRIKCDPRKISSEDFASIDSYEGFILEEDDEIIKVMIIKQGMPIVQVPREFVKPQTTPQLSISNLNSFKRFVVKLFKSGDPLVKLIQKSSSVEQMESNLLQNNFTPDKVVKLYRDFVNGKELSLTEEVNPPSTMGALGNVAKAGIGAVGSALANAGNTAGKVKQFSNQLSQGNYGQIYNQVAGAIKGAWDAARIKQNKQFLDKIDWPQGQIKVGGQMKIINETIPNLNNKIGSITKIVPTSQNVTYYFEVMGAVGPLGAVTGIMIQDLVNQHEMKCKFSEDGQPSQKFNVDQRTGDGYFFQFNPLRQQYELLFNVHNRTRNKDRFIPCEVPKGTVAKVGDVIDGLISLNYGWTFRGKIVAIGKDSKGNQIVNAEVT